MTADGRPVRRALGWLTGLAMPGPRLVDELECAASVLLAIVFGHLVGARNVSWAAFSGYMVMRGHVAESLNRGALRVLGTVSGAGLAVAYVDVAGLGSVGAALVLAIVGSLTLFAALTMTRSYAWLFTGLTFAMIVIDQIEHPGASLWGFASTRVVEVLAGTTACVVISMLSALSLRRRWPAPDRQAAKFGQWRPEAMRHAAQAGIALALVPLIRLVWPAPELSQAAVAIMAVMMVPASDIGSSGLWPVTRRMAMRVAGCAAGAGFAVGMLLAAHGNAAALVAGAAVGVMLGRHIENAQSSVTYVGTQFTLAVLVTLVPDSYSTPDMHAGWARLVGTLVGLATLQPVLLAWHAVAPRAVAVTPKQQNEPGTA